MLFYWMLLLLISGFAPEICEPSSKHIAKKKDIPRSFFSKQIKSFKEKGRLASSLKRNKVSMSDGVADKPLKQGSFKIDDGKVIGGGIYDIGKDGISIDLKIKIAPDYPQSPNAQPTPSSKPGGPGVTTEPGASGVTTVPSGSSGTTAAPTTGGAETTAAPGGAETTAASGGAETTAAPGGAETTAASGGAENTAAPGGAEATAAPGGAETTAAPGGAETTAAPGGAETTAAPGGGSETTAPASATGTTAAPTSSTGSDMEQEALALHNKFRKVHDAPAMTLNAEMSQSAASYAQKIANQGSLQHASPEERDNNGENLSYGCSSSQGQTATEAVTNWYNEICDPGYSFGSESMGGAGHFTQLVWKESVELGFGKADADKNGMKCTYYVARYKKAGNMIGDFAENVVKGSFDQSYCSSIKKSNLKKLF